jgi:hypothetical protein
VKRLHFESTAMNGEGVTKLVPANEPRLPNVQAAVAEMKSRRITLNPTGKPKLRVTDIVNEGRP